MNEVHKSHPDAVRGADGLLYNPGVRGSMGTFAAGEDTLPLEAAAALRSAWQAVDRLRSQGAGGRGLSTGALDVLARLAVADHDLNVGELARACGVTSRNVTGLVDTLERDRLAERIRDPQDRRSVRVVITATGREWLESFRQPTQRAMSAIFAGFTPDELAQLQDLCLRVVDNQHRIEQYLATGDTDRSTS
ncbi:MarR family transcriptional regulator [Nocardia sp. SYP-A9097]|uniref:MarR family winged helix-turn-helix transcriptional regulator n=1 Tax=Nocardia sp. SYP-A9097 TaxID=2663237 RepID=UPI00129B980A|nr:MarR family transcriptional regulator [Nocardia sp. SYP-A9097]MRH92313.1 MarR family transcriptional regulator [Nocardia sp. SYP-A9097]